MLTKSFLIESLSFFMTLISPKIPTLIIIRYEPFNLDNIDSAECKAEFRIEKADLPRLAEALQLPPTFHCQQRTVFDSMEGLCMLLKRVSYPCRYSDMIPRFGRPVSTGGDNSNKGCLGSPMNNFMSSQKFRPPSRIFRWHSP